MNSEQPETDPWTLFIDELYACVHDVESRECLVAMAESLEEQSAVQLGLVRDTANGWQANCAEKDAELLALRTDRSRWEAQHDRQVETILALRAATAQLRSLVQQVVDAEADDAVGLALPRNGRSERDYWAGARVVGQNRQSVGLSIRLSQRLP